MKIKPLTLSTKKENYKLSPQEGGKGMGNPNRVENIRFPFTFTGK